jgi:hypothetical protein
MDKRKNLQNTTQNIKDRALIGTTLQTFVKLRRVYSYSPTSTNFTLIIANSVVFTFTLT